MIKLLVEDIENFEISKTAPEFATLIINGMEIIISKKALRKVHQEINKIVKYI